MGSELWFIDRVQASAQASAQALVQASAQALVQASAQASALASALASARDRDLKLHQQHRWLAVVQPPEQITLLR